MKIGIVIPIANEEETVVEFTNSLIQLIRKRKEVIHVFFVMDNFSKDKTASIIDNFVSKYPFIEKAYFTNSTGVVSCYLHGHQILIDRDYEISIEMDSGLSHPVEKLNEIIDNFSDDLDCIFMSRLAYGGSIVNMPWWRVLITKFAIGITNLLFSLPFSDSVGGFKAIRTSKLQDLINFDQYVCGSGWQLQMKILCKDMKVLEIPYTYKASKTTFRFFWIVEAVKGLYLMKKLGY